MLRNSIKEIPNTLAVRACCISMVGVALVGPNWAGSTFTCGGIKVLSCYTT